MKRSHLVLLVVLSAALSAILTSFLIRHWQEKPAVDLPQSHPGGPAPASNEDFHGWLHQKLDLSPAQRKKLQPTEERFEVAHRELLAELQSTSSHLAHILSETDRDTTDLDAIMARKIELQGQIQQLVVSHLLEKQAILTPDQRERYRRWIHQSINHDHGD